MSCVTQCAPAMPVYLSGGCGANNVKKGGWGHVIFVKCDATLPTDYCDPEEWETLVTACQIRMTGSLLGSKAAGSDTLLRTSSCLPEQPVAGTKTWTFTDFNTSLSAQEYRFWNHFKMNARYYKVGFLDCENRFYGFYTYGLSVNEEKDDNINGTSRITGTFTIEEVQLLIPTKLPAETITLLTANQDYDCATSAYIDDFSISCESINLSPASQTYTIDSAGLPPEETITINLDRTNCATPTPLVLEFLDLPTGMTVTVDATVGTPTTSQDYIFAVSGTPVGTYEIYVRAVSGQTNCETNVALLLITVI